MRWPWTNDRLPLLRCIDADDCFRFGYRLGEAVRNYALFVLWQMKIAPVYEEFRAQGLLDRSYNFLSKNYPELSRELSGLAAGVGADNLELIALNFFEDLVFARAERCSLIFRKEKDQVLMGWNEDGEVHNQGRMSLIHSRLPHLEFVTLNYPGLLCGDTLAVTSHGLVIALQSLWPKHQFQLPVGLPRGLMGRLFLEAKDMLELRELVLGFNVKNFMHGWHLFAYSLFTEEMMSVEFYPYGADNEKLSWRYWHGSRSPSFFAHTNHYLWEGLSCSENQNITASSHSRLTYLELFKKYSLTLEMLADIMSNKPPEGVHTAGNNICRHGAISTLHSQILLAKKGEKPILWTSPGLPCQHLFKKWRKDKLSFVR